MNVLDYIIFEPTPTYYNSAYEHNKALGWVSTELTPDTYDITVVKPGHCPLKHIIEITIPKIEKIKNNIDGFFIIEGDVKINISYNEFLKMNITVPTWLGYKKKLKDYIVGNFLIYIPINYFDEFKNHMSVKRLIYSDRLFTRLLEQDWLHLHHETLAHEIPHFSNVLGKWRN